VLQINGNYLFFSSFIFVNRNQLLFKLQTSKQAKKKKKKRKKKKNKTKSESPALCHLTEWERG